MLRNRTAPKTRYIRPRIARSKSIRRIVDPHQQSHLSDGNAHSRHPNRTISSHTGYRCRINHGFIVQCLGDDFRRKVLQVETDHLISLNTESIADKDIVEVAFWINRLRDFPRYALISEPIVAKFHPRSNHCGGK